MATNPAKLRPTIQQRRADPICPECGGPVVRSTARGRAPIFCCSAHKLAFQARLAAEGRAIAALAKAWRIDRGQGEIAQTAFRQFVAILDEFNAQDQRDGRERADLYAAKLMGEGFQYQDRRRR